MRIRGGSAKGREIFAPKGLNTRPTSDKVKEAIFNVLAGKVCGARVLDLCAGTGNLSLEAISRGADSAVLVEKHPKTVSIIEKNFTVLGFRDQVSILKMDVLKALPLLAERGTSFEIIFFDPPYEAELYEPVLEYLSTAGDFLLAENGVIVVEASTRKYLPDKLAALELRKESIYGDTKIRYYQF